MGFLVFFIVLVATFSIWLTFNKKIRKWIPNDLDQTFRSLDRLSTRKVYKVKLFHKNVYFVNDPELIHKVLTSEACLEKPGIIYKFFLLNDSILCCNYSQWVRDRKNFSCSFNNVMVHAFVPIFCEIADRMVEQIKMSDFSKTEVDMLHFTEQCTIKMILASSFNIFARDTDNPDMKFGKIAEAVKITSLLLSERFRKLHWFFDAIFHRTKQYRKQMAIRDELFNMMLETLDSKSKKKESPQPRSFIDNIFLNRLMAHKDEMTLSQIKESVYIMIGAGFETTGTASAHCILFLAMHLDIQERAYQEILDVYPTADAGITPESLTKLQYIECVMKESLRLGPTVHSIAREAMSNFEISADKTAKKGSIFCINIYGLHRRKDLWGDDAELFNPDRFLPENFGDRQQYFIPFSVGKRNCIGYRYAYTSFKIMMVKLLRNFKFTTNLKLSELKFNRQIALKLEGKHLVMIERRN